MPSIYRFVPAVPVVVLAALAITACARKEPAAPAQVDAAPAPAAADAAHAGPGSHRPPGIAWFDGDVDAAFAAAKAAPKPLFLYWGAEWCPPCAQIKSTIFNRREFQERSRLFVPVYLDGDTPSAQKQGERFGVVGYPTMILFRPDGTEITRLPGSVGVERYGRILDVALADARPVKEILAAATQGGEVSSNDWQLLAYYSWATDNERLVAGRGSRRNVQDAEPALPCRDARRLRAALLRLPRGRVGRRRRRQEATVGSRARGRPQAPARVARVSGGRPRQRRQPAVWTEGRDQPAFRCRQSGAQGARPGLERGAGPPRQRRRVAAVRARAVERASRPRAAGAARRTRRAAAARAARADPDDGRACRCRDDGSVRAPGNGQCGRGHLLGGRAERRRQPAAGRGTREIHDRPTISCWTSPSLRRRRAARTRPCNGSPRPTRERRDRRRASSGAPATSSG